MDKKFHSTLYQECDYISMLGFKLIRLSERAPCHQIIITNFGLRVALLLWHWYFLAATKQLYKWYFPSVCLSVRPSVCLSVRPSVRHTFLTMFPSSYHHEIFRSYYQWQIYAKGQGQRSKVKVTEVTTQLNRFRTVTPIWIHIWWWNDAYILIMLRKGALLFLKVIRQIWRSHGSKNRRIWPRLGFSGL